MMYHHVGETISLCIPAHINQSLLSIPKEIIISNIYSNKNPVEIFKHVIIFQRYLEKSSQTFWINHRLVLKHNLG
jgi:hypothetical protein